MKYSLCKDLNVIFGCGKIFEPLIQVVTNSAVVIVAYDKAMLYVWFKKLDVLLLLVIKLKVQNLRQLLERVVIFIILYAFFYMSATDFLKVHYRWIL